MKKSCDHLWAQVVKLRAGVCERCPRPATEAHHAYGRTDHRLRFELRNGVGFCHACHRWAEQFPLEFADWFRRRRPDDAEWLLVERRKGLIPNRTLIEYLDLEDELQTWILMVEDGLVA